ncbi:MAG: hypothetical protein HYU66_01105 [Armatimonadetes bacterium]|nr:hypothetical protein [Armatimonadota bacterium]
MIPAETAPAERFPWRAIVFGALVLPPFTYFGMVAYIIVQTATWMGDSLLRGPLLLLFLLTALSLLLRRLGLRWGLSQSELLIVFAMVSLGTAMCGTGWAMFVVPSMAGAPVFYSDGNAAWKSWIDLIPAWFMVHDRTVIEQLHYGQASLWSGRALRALLPPGITWTAFMLLLVGAHHCVAELLARPWIQRERLTFPLTALPLAMTRVEQPAFWRDRGMWAGFLLAAVVECHNSVAYLVPALPVLPVKIHYWPAAVSRPLSGMGSIWTALYPFMIGIAFLIPLDVSLSLWLFFLLTRVQDTVAMMLGYRDVGGWSLTLPPYHGAQNSGAVLMLAVMLLWRVRGELWRGVRGRDRSHRAALTGLLGCGVGVCWLAANAGIPPLVTAIWMVLYLLVAVTLGRLVAETGIPTAMWPFPPQEILYAFTGSTILTRRQLVAFTWLRNFDERYADTPIMHQLTGLRLWSDMGRGWRPMHAALAVGGAVGIVGGMAALLKLYFTYGLATAATRQWPAKDVALGPWRFLQGLLDRPLAYDAAKVNGMLAGAAVMALLVFLRARFAGCPVHPIGYAVAANWAMNEQWFPCFLGWLLKLVVLRTGGIRLYRRGLPVALGLVLGDLVIPVLWAVVGVVTGRQMYLAFPH